MEPSLLPCTELPTFTPIDTQSAISTISNVYHTLKCSLTDARLARAMGANYILNQGNKFSKTINLTLKSSQDGIILAMDALTLFSALEKEYDNKALTDYFEGLDKIAGAGLSRAQQCHQQFLDDIELLCEVGRKPIKTSVYSAGEEPHWQGEGTRLIELLSSGGTLSFLSLPFTVPSLIKRGTRRMWRAKPKGAKTNNAAPTHAYEELEMELDNIRAYLSHLVAWWSDTKNKLCQLGNILRCHGNSSFRDALVRGSFQQTWMSIKKEHSTYRDQVYMVQDYYPQFKSSEDVHVRRAY